MSTIHPKYSTEMHQNTTFYAELNGEHAGEGFMPLRSTLLEIWTHGTKKSRNFRKFDLLPAITGSNIDLGPKIIPPIASTPRVQYAGHFCEALRRFVWKRQGGRGRTPPTPAKVAKHCLRARVNPAPPPPHIGTAVAVQPRPLKLSHCLHRSQSLSPSPDCPNASSSQAPPAVDIPFSAIITLHSSLSRFPLCVRVIHRGSSVLSASSS